MLGKKRDQLEREFNSLVEQLRGDVEAAKPKPPTHEKLYDLERGGSARFERVVVGLRLQSGEVHVDTPQRPLAILAPDAPNIVLTPPIAGLKIFASQASVFLIEFAGKG